MNSIELVRSLSRHSGYWWTGWLVTLALLLLRLTPGMFQPGMFFDGLTYATLARNMAVGRGDFWHPVFSAAAPPFREQPPLALWLESWLFRCLGDHYGVERLYSVLTAVASAVVIAAIWRRVVSRRSEELGTCDWLPVMLWILLPGWGWIYENNMLENTLGLFALLAVYAAVRWAEGGRLSWFWLAPAVAGTMAAVLSKGPVGLFPLIAPLWAGVFVGRFGWVKSILGSFALAALTVGSFALLGLQPDARAFAHDYLHGQVLASLAGAREHVNSPLGRFDVVWRIVGQVALPLAIGAAAIWWARRRENQSGAIPSNSAEANLRPAVLLFLAMGLCASLPIMLSPKQSGHYAFPSYPYYVLAIAAWCAPALMRLWERSDFPRISARAVRASAVAAMASCLFISWLLSNRPHRDKDIYRDTQAIIAIVGRDGVVGLAPELATDWPLQNYLARNANIGAEPNDAPHEYLVASKTADVAPPPGYAVVATPLEKYRLFQQSATAAMEGSSGPRSARKPMSNSGR